MASQPPEVVGQILAIPVAHIVVGERLRPIEPDWAAALGQIMAVEEQKTPIEVCRLPGHRDYLLVAGAHRLVGAQLQGWKTINAVVVGSGAIERRLREMAENLWRKGLNPIDRASFVAELIGLLKVQAGIDPAKDGRVVSAQVRWQKDLQEQSDDATAMIADAYGFTDLVGEQLGLAPRTIRNDLLLHRRLSPALVERLRGLPIASNSGQLLALAKMEPTTQAAVADLLVGGTAKSVAEAMGVINGSRPLLDGQAKLRGQFVSLWGRLSVKSIRLVLAGTVACDQRLPDDLKALLAPLAPAKGDGKPSE